MALPRLAAITLFHFKSFKDVRIPIEPLTVLIGRNGSGKSNALDAFEVLGRLARGLDVRDALDGSLDGLSPIRGGSTGLAPAGSKSGTIKLGVEVEVPSHGVLSLEVEIEVDPEPKIVSERLTLTGLSGRKSFTVFETIPQEDRWRGDIEARVHNANRGLAPRTTLRSAQLLTFQLPQRLEQSSAAKRRVGELCTDVLTSLLGVFHLDPVPSAMRQYVPEKDVDLRRDARNLSAVLFNMSKEAMTDALGKKDAWLQLTSALQALPEHPIASVTFAATGFGDVMAGIREDFDKHKEIIPAKQMSDGTLRMLAIAAAILGGSSNLALAPTFQESAVAPTILIEELENGLHASQAHNLLELIVKSIASGAQQLIVTTHSPALLNALNGDQHEGVLIVTRDPATGWSFVNRLVDLPGYHRTLASDSLGNLVEQGRLSEAFEVPQISRERIIDLFGMG